LYDEYCLEMPAGFADQIIASGRMQRKLQLDTTVMLADTIEKVGEFSKHMTSHPAIMARPVNHRTSCVLSNAATVPTPVGPEPMELTVANTNTRCYCGNGLGYEARDCATPKTHGYGQAFHATTGVHPSR
jgi:hypothetical protein